MIEQQSPGDPCQRRRAWIAAGLCASAVAALAVRAATAPSVFPGGGRVRLGAYDAAYHARRASYTFENFPAVLGFDRYIAWPDGASVPWPPAYDWVLGAFARLFGTTESVFAHVAAWSSPALGVLTLWPVYAIGRLLGGSGVGLGAAALYALLPAASLRSLVGDCDHHALVTLLAATWLASSLVETRGFRPGGRVLHAAGHAALVAAMLLSWNGSLFYLALGEGARLFVASVVARAPERLLAQAAGALATTLAVAPVLAASGEPSGGWFSSTTLSWLHVTVLLALALVAFALAEIEVRRPEPRAARRTVRLVAVGCALGLALLALPPLRDAFFSGAGFLAKADVWAVTNVEQRPLFDPTPSSLKRSATERFGWFAFLVPLTPVLVGVRLLGAGREPIILLGIWSSVLALLALQQVRFAHDFAAPGAALFAWTLAGAARLARRGVGAPLAVAGGALLLWPAVEGVHRPAFEVARAQIARWGDASPRRIRASETLWRFAESVRAATPETSGFLDASQRPEYGLLVDASLGHAMLWGARRPVPANNFGPYLDGDKLSAVHAFYAARSEAEALEIARSLATSFVVTAARERTPAGRLQARLHRLDGSAGEGYPHLAHFRLITEAPSNGSPLALFFPALPRPLHLVPYKLFEVVEGALLEVEAGAGDALQAEVELATPGGRRVPFRARGEAGADGIARLHLPYATEPIHPVRTTGPWRIAVAGRSWMLEVPEDAVRRGATLRLP